jgi:hypothetical protein
MESGSGMIEKTGQEAHLRTGGRETDEAEYDSDMDEEEYSWEPITIDPEFFRCPSKLIAFMKNGNVVSQLS